MDLTDLAATPSQATPQPPQQGGGGGLTDLAATAPAAGGGLTNLAAPAATAQPSTMQTLKTYDPTIGILSGALKEAQKHVAGAIDLVNKYVIAPKDPGATATTQRISDAAKQTADWLRKNTEEDTLLEKGGGYGESTAELLAPETWGGKAVEGMSYADRLLAMAKNAKILEGNPGLLKTIKLGLSAAKTATEAAGVGAKTGAQTFVESGGDTDAAERSAMIGAGTAGVIGAGTRGVSALADALKPSSEVLEGQSMPVAASQKPGASIAAKLASQPGDIPAIESARQAAAPEIIQNGARRALKNVLDDVNTSRGQMQGPVDEFGVKPGAYRFTVAPHGEPVQTTDPNFVQKLLNEAQDLKGSGAFDEMGPRQQARVENTVNDLSRQLDEYHTDLATRPHFTPIDVDAALKHTTDYRTAGDIMQNSVDDVYQRMRGAANEQLDKKWLKQLSPKDFNVLMEQNADKFSPEERQIATDTFRKGAVLKQWHDAIQQGFNISPEQAAATADVGGNRTFTGSNKISSAIDDVVAEHGDDLRGMLGDEGIRSVRRMNQLMQDPETGSKLQQILRHTAAVMRRHYGGVAGMVGAAAAPFLGVSHLTGMTGGAATGYALQKVINHMASDPAVAGRIAYAVEHGVAPRIAAPLIATMIIRANDQDQEGAQANAGNQ